MVKSENRGWFPNSSTFTDNASSNAAKTRTVESSSRCYVLYLPSFEIHLRCFQHNKLNAHQSSKKRYDALTSVALVSTDGI